MCWVVCPGVVVEGDVELVEEVDDDGVVFVGYFAWVYSSLGRLNLDGCAMLVRAADKDNSVALGPEVACENVG